MEKLIILGLIMVGHFVSGLLALYLIGRYDVNDRLEVYEDEYGNVLIFGYVSLCITLLYITGNSNILKSIHKRGFAKRMEKKVTDEE